MEKNKIIVVTGGAGFVGSHLCKSLSSLLNTKVISIDNYFTGSIDNHVRNVEYIHGDACDIEQYVSHADIVYHLGEYSRVEQSFEDIDIVWNSNKNGIFGVLQFCKKHSAKLVYAGSSTKYADQGEGPYQSPYAWTKASNTDFVKAYTNWFDLNYAITYFYNVYGKREISEGKYATLIAKFTEQMKRNQPLTVVSPGTQLRNFTHINDIINGLLLVGQYGVGDGYGIGHPSSYSIIDVAKMFDPDVIQYLPKRPGNRSSAEVITDQTRALGWEPKHNLQEYIEQLRNNKWDKTRL